MNQASSPGRGKLQVVVRTADGVLPVADAAIRIYASDREADNTGILYSLRSDRSGLSDTVELDAPPRSLSLTPGNPVPYARYNIAVQKEGYGTVRNIGVPVFDGVLSTQQVTLIPLSEFERNREESIVESDPAADPLQ